MFSSHQDQLKDNCNIYYFKLTYILNLLHHINSKLAKLWKELFKEKCIIKLDFNSFKIKIYFSNKDLISQDLKVFLVYKVTYASGSSSYLEKTCCHFKTRIEENIKKDSKSQNFKHLHSMATCFDSYNYFLF